MPPPVGLFLGELEVGAAREQGDDQLVQADVLLGGEVSEMSVQPGAKAHNGLAAVGVLGHLRDSIASGTMWSSQKAGPQRLESPGPMATEKELPMQAERTDTEVPLGDLIVRVGKGTATHYGGRRASGELYTQCGAESRGGEVRIADAIRPVCYRCTRHGSLHRGLR